MKCGDLERNEAATLYATYDAILATIVGMINHKDKWLLPQRKDK